jgi:hypothetical protein
LAFCENSKDFQWKKSTATALGFNREKRETRPFFFGLTSTLPWKTIRKIMNLPQCMVHIQKDQGFLL